MSKTMMIDILKDLVNDIESDVIPQKDYRDLEKSISLYLKG